MSYAQPTGCNCLCHGIDGSEGDGDPCEECSDHHEEIDGMADAPARGRGYWVTASGQVQVDPRVLARSPAVLEMQRLGAELVRRNREGGGS